jgi:hypothetical protein
MWVGTTYLSAGHIKSEAASWKLSSFALLPRCSNSCAPQSSFALRNNYYFPFASLRGNMTLFLRRRLFAASTNFP